MPSRAPIAPADWTPSTWHGVAGSPRWWRITEQGVATTRQDGRTHEPTRTWPGHEAIDGEPLRTLPLRVYDRHADGFDTAAGAFGVPLSLLVAIACAESQGQTDAERYEPHLRDRSIGIMQTLTSTAWQQGLAMGWPQEDEPADEALAALPDVLPEVERLPMPVRPLPQGGDHKAWRAWLSQPYVSIVMGAATLVALDRRWELLGDPVLLAAAYNAGGPYADVANPWGLRQHGPYLDTVTRFIADAIALGVS
ncbi:MAG: transglycosylase SLT domain-containing protein [Bacteroidetes bacterium]|jgi:hypothetical protein|nr:transglycosylase SLT domain-containing protein [Bacteroidota bacterium]